MEKILFALDLPGQDEFDLSKGVEDVLALDWPKEVWSAVTDTLLGRLQAKKAPEGGERGILVDQIADALDRAGRGDEVLPVFEAEAARTNRYERLVQRLMQARRLEDAERWAREGIQRVDRFAAAPLRDALRELAGKRRDWQAVAAYRAEECFNNAGQKTFQTLLKAAEKAGCAEAVRAGALYYLETGKRPDSPDATGQPIPAWPLPAVPRHKPDPDLEKRLGIHRPHFSLLLELAIEEKRPADVLHWYERLITGRQGYGWSDDDTKARVAEAVAQTHPEWALKAYRELGQRPRGPGNPSGYEAAAPYLERLRDLYAALGRQADWKSYLAELRSEHRRKRRLMEVLERVESARSKGRR